MAENGFNRREFLRRTAGCGLGAAALPLAGLACGGPAGRSTADGKRPPNFVVLFADDMGYGDWEYGGHPTIRTPNLNRMAAEGVRLTQFYSGGPVCSPSRAALLTGRNYVRCGVLWVFTSPDTRGLSPEEVTIAEALKPLGYSSACIGKWHLGDAYEYRPLRQGFDYYYGLLYSNDMKNPDLWRGDEKIEAPADQSTLTRRYTAEAISFIEKNREAPFFLYLPYTFPHIPLHASESFLGKSLRGLYGDVVQEVDWSVGEILGTLDRLQLGSSTLVIFTSDNGPWYAQRLNGGSSGLLRGAKGDTWEGGMREPFVARWTGRIPAGTVSEGVGTVLDFLPTLVGLAGGSLSSDRPIDGIDLLPTLEGRVCPERTIYYYQCRGGEYLNAVRHGKWKLHFRIFDPTLGDYHNPASWTDLEKPLLFDLEEDPGERFDQAEKYPEEVAKLTGLARDYRAEIARCAENRELAESFLTPWRK